ncbi:MAG: response regulator transcription factor [Gammaproteobacteria bacterium]
MQKKRLLIVEDEATILQGLIDVFIYHGFDVYSATDGKTGLDKALHGHYALILLDVMLPEIDGFTICNRIREQDQEQPIIMLTAKSSEEDIITGLTLGADDYIAKPFSVRELVLRVQSVLKRSQAESQELALLDLGNGICIDTLNRQQIGCTEPLLFSRREIDILQYLQQNHHRPVTREELLEKIWGYRHADRIETRTVDIHIAKLRRKIEADHRQPQCLITVRGEGYRLSVEE